MDMKLSVQGMSCDKCVSHVKSALEGVPGVEQADVDLASASATVQGQNLELAQLVEALEEEGYSAQAAP